MMCTQTNHATPILPNKPFLTNLIRQVLKDASTYHYKSDKLKEIVATPEYVPPSAAPWE